MKPLSTHTFLMAWRLDRNAPQQTSPQAGPQIEYTGGDDNLIAVHFWSALSCQVILWWIIRWMVICFLVLAELQS